MEGEKRGGKSIYSSPFRFRAALQKVSTNARFSPSPPRGVANRKGEIHP